ncbi:MAG: isoprenyl transferase [Acidobacteriota bacterium]
MSRPAVTACAPSELLEFADPDTRSVIEQIDWSRLSRHVAVIMDGNGRWAGQRGLPRVEGHRAGIKAVRDVVETAARAGIETLTLYAFSVENWKRPRQEIDALMGLLKEYLRRELSTLLKHSVRFDAIGRLEGLPDDVRTDVREAMAATSANTGMRFVIGLNYGGRTEIVDAVRGVVKDLQRQALELETLDEQVLGRYLYTAHLPDPDLLIRTSGELRVSNFMLYQIAYSEIWVTSKLWPDFRRADFLQAIADFQRRERRYGDVGGESG